MLTECEMRRLSYRHYEKPQPWNQNKNQKYCIPNLTEISRVMYFTRLFLNIRFITDDFYSPFPKCWQLTLSTMKNVCIPKQLFHTIAGDKNLQRHIRLLKSNTVVFYKNVEDRFWQKFKNLCKFLTKCYYR